MKAIVLKQTRLYGEPAFVGDEIDVNAGDYPNAVRNGIIELVEEPKQDPPVTKIQTEDNGSVDPVNTGPDNDEEDFDFEEDEEENVEATLQEKAKEKPQVTPNQKNSNKKK